MDRIVFPKNRYICIAMDFDDFDDIVKYDLLFNDDEPPRRRSSPQPPNSGSGCLTGCIVIAAIVLWSSF